MFTHWCSGVNYCPGRKDETVTCTHLHHTYVPLFYRWKHAAAANNSVTEFFLHSALQKTLESMPAMKWYSAQLAQVHIMLSEKVDQSCWLPSRNYISMSCPKPTSLKSNQTSIGVQYVYTMRKVCGHMSDMNVSFLGNKLFSCWIGHPGHKKHLQLLLSLTFPCGLTCRCWGTLAPLGFLQKSVWCESLSSSCWNLEKMAKT